MGEPPARPSATPEQNPDLVRFALPDHPDEVQTLGVDEAESEARQTRVQVHIVARFVEVSREAFDAFKAEHSYNAPSWQLGMAKPQSTNGICVLTDGSSSAVLHALGEKPDVTLLNEMAVTTLSGRQCQMQAVDLQTVVMGINTQALAFPGVTRSALKTQSIPSGPVLDIVPTVMTNDWSIHMTLFANVMEFLGYDKPTQKTRVYEDGKSQEIDLPLPRFRVQNCETRAILRNRQTLVLGCESLNVSCDGLGNSTTTTNTDTSLKKLLVFVTPTLIDAAGNPIHEGKK